VPAGAWATIEGDLLTLRGVLATVDGHVVCRASSQGEDVTALGYAVADAVIEDYEARVGPR
jgi:hypothetical protein